MGEKRREILGLKGEIREQAYDSDV